MSTVYSSGTWRPSPGREHEFIEAWKEFAAWTSRVPGAGPLRLTHDLDEQGRYVSFSDWASEDAIRAWKGSPEFKERLAHVLQHVSEFRSSPLGLVATVEEGGGAPPAVHYRKDGIATFRVPLERIFAYMRAGSHPHKAFASHRVVSVEGNHVTVAVEVYNPDGSTTPMTVAHRLDPPREIVTTMHGGHFDGARFVHSFTPLGDGVKVDLEGDFPALPGMPAADELAMIDGFLTTVFGEDAETLPTWSANGHE